MSKIEYINRHGQITEAEIREGLAETKRRQAQPGYAAAERRRMEEAERRAKSRGVKFPELANSGTRPAVAANDLAARRLNLLNR